MNKFMVIIWIIITVLLLMGIIFSIVNPEVEKNALAALVAAFALAILTLWGYIDGDN